MKKNLKPIRTAALAAVISSVLAFTACGGETSSDLPVSGTVSEPSASTNSANSDPISSREPASDQPNATDPSSFSYEETDGGIAVTYYNGDDKDVVIPASIDGKPVVKIGNDYDKVIRSNVTESVYIPGSVKTIGTEAFSRCYYLTSVIMAEGVTTIEANAFNRSEELVNISIPKSVTDIESYAVFSGTPWFENQKAEDPLVIINSNVLYGKGCTGEIKIPNGVTSIKMKAFSGCGEMTSIALPESLKSIESEAFASCRKLTNVVIPNSVEEIGSGAFSGCTGFTGIALPGSLKSLGENAFKGCSDLTEITFPDTPIEIGWDAFERTAWLDNKRGETPLVIAGCNLIDGYNCKGDVVIPDSVKSIATGTFGINSRYYNDYPSVTSVTLPSGLKKIPEKFFYGNSKIKSVIIPDSVEEIYKDAFHAAPDDCKFTYKGTAYTNRSELFAAINGTNT